MIDITELSVAFGRKEVLRDLSFTLNTDGKITGVFGPNGAGKTTLLRVLVGLIGRYEGEVHVDDPQSLAFLPDDPYLYGVLRLRDCIDLFACRYNDFRRENALKTFADLGLDQNQRISECSRGMREQIHLGLTMARDARLYVFDEPLAAVDPLTRDKLIALILEHRASGSGIVISTHLISEVEELFDEVVMINEGRIVHQGPFSDLQQEEGVSLEGFFKNRMATV